MTIISKHMHHAATALIALIALSAACPGATEAREAAVSPADWMACTHAIDLVERARVHRHNALVASGYMVDELEACGDRAYASVDYGHMHALALSKCGAFDAFMGLIGTILLNNPPEHRPGHRARYEAYDVLNDANLSTPHCFEAAHARTREELDAHREQVAAEQLLEDEAIAICRELIATGERQARARRE